MGLVNEAVPKAKLKERTTAARQDAAGKNPPALRACKAGGPRRIETCPGNLRTITSSAKSDQLRFLDDENGRNGGLTQFLDEKSYRPGLGAMRREKK